MNEIEHNIYYDFTDLDKTVNKVIQDGITPSVQLAISKGQELIYNKAYGGWEDEKNTLDTIYDLASVTKIMSTTQLAMVLHSEGKLDVNAHVTDYLKDYGKNGKSHLKVRDLLTHTAGFKDWEPIYLYADGREEVLEYLSNRALDYATGTKRIYSDLGYISLGFIIEHITGKRVDELFVERIAKPLGLSYTTYLPLEKKKDFHIAPTSLGNPCEHLMIDNRHKEGACSKKSSDFKGWREYRIRGEGNDCNTWHAMKGVSSHAGLFSNARELSVLTRLMQAGGSYKGIKLYDKESFDEFTKIQSEFGHGYGFEIGQGSPEGGYMGYYANNDVVGHTGFSGTAFIVDKARDISVVILSNKQYGGLKGKEMYPSTALITRPIIKAVYESGIISKDKLAIS